MALLAYEAHVEVAGKGMRTVAALYGDGSDARRDHQLGPRRAAHFHPDAGAARGRAGRLFRARAQRGMAARRSGRAACCVNGGRIAFARVAVGGIAPIPCDAAGEAALVGQPANTETMRRAASSAGDGVRPLPMTAYKVDVLCATVLQALEHALG